jgi:DNA-binding NtrC family response regulator
MARWRILVTGDADACDPLAAGLVADGYAVDRARNAHDALALTRDQDYAVSILDLSGGGFEALTEIRRMRPQCFVLLLTDPGSVHPRGHDGNMDAVEIAVKPCRPDDIASRVSRIIEIQNLRRENDALRGQLAQSLGPGTRAITPGMKLNEMEKLLIAATLQHTRGNIKEAASVLGIDRSTLYEKLKRYGIPRR